MTITDPQPPAEPGYFGGEQTDSERSWYEAFKSAGKLLPFDVWSALESMTGERVIEAYEYGVAAGLNQLVPEDVEHMTREKALGTARAALDRLSAFIGQIDEMPG